MMKTRTTLLILIAVAGGTAPPDAEAAASFAPSSAWSLDKVPAILPPAAPYCENQADPEGFPEGFPEVNMDFRIAPGPFEPTWESIRGHPPGTPESFSEP